MREDLAIKYRIMRVVGQKLEDVAHTSGGQKICFCFDNRIENSGPAFEAGVAVRYLLGILNILI